MPDFNRSAYTLIVILIAVIVIMTTLVIIRETAKTKFDSKFDDHQIALIGNPIPVGQTSVTHPAPTTFLDIPERNENLISHPRSWNLDGCRDVPLPSKITTLYAAAPAAIADQIVIQMPISGGKHITVCGPDGVSTSVFLWSD